MLTASSIRARVQIPRAHVDAAQEIPALEGRGLQNRLGIASDMGLTER